MSEGPEHYLHLPEDEALEEHARASTEAVFWRLAGAVAVIAAGAALLFFALEKWAPMGIALADVIVIAGLYMKSSAPAVSRRSRAIAVAFLIVHIVALVVLPLWGLDPAVRVALAVVAFPAFFLFLQLSRAQMGLLLATAWGAGVWVWLTELEGLWNAPQGLGGVLWPTLATAAFAAGAGSLAGHRRRGFLDGWRRASTRRRERERIRTEIEDARQIQLSMLPRSVPRLDWLDIARASMPASEVGGDYYDYFPQEDGSLAVVVGDVAGHGLASGLLLAAVRSCLYLLRRELTGPVDVLKKLDDMVRHTSHRRMLVTLQCAYLDAGERRLSLASAGHPPALLWRAASGEVEEVGLPAMPLGTRLGRFEEVHTHLADGDVLLLYTDGMTEMLSGAGEAFGGESLARRLRTGRRERSARDLRNEILADLADFKGDTRREDDVTLLVLRVRETSREPDSE